MVRRLLPPAAATKRPARLRWASIDPDFAAAAAAATVKFYLPPDTGQD